MYRNRLRIRVVIGSICTNLAVLLVLEHFGMPHWKAMIICVLATLGIAILAGAGAKESR